MEGADIARMAKLCPEEPHKMDEGVDRYIFDIEYFNTLKAWRAEGFHAFHNAEKEARALAQA